ncbi:MAG: monofunctional biosynthetic peptidoglycan transglycosylase [Balneolaceae bacterium]|nr:monofunctional biosynthetic peptidoglycan transglycosylase [Balneolaceae bacterium]
MPDDTTIQETSSEQPGIPGFRRLIEYSLVGLLMLSIVPVVFFRWVNPPTTAFMLQEKYLGKVRDGEPSELKHDWVPWERISKYVKMATVTSEDQRFFQHRGFDLTAIEEALNENRKTGELRGASTITQQVAKNLFLWPGRSFIRKGIEAYLTVLIELFWSKKRILEVYLNIAQFGPNVFGVEAAARTYFGTPAARLNMMQSALLVTALPSPERYNLADPSPYMIERRNWVLKYMHLLGYTEYLEGLE